MNSITPAEVSRHINSGKTVRLLDVRELNEHEFVALPNSILIPLAELEVRAAEIAAWMHEEVVVYCHHGIRSAHAVEILVEQGFRNAVNLSGGIDRWSIEVDQQLPRY